eukprot:Gb_17915 [translate_table: standard]
MEMNTMNDPVQSKGRVCVTGGGGYIGSWLVKTLLDDGYTVHATLRDPGNKEKASCLTALPGAKERLTLFKADLCDEGSFDAAIHGCQGVFHVATPADFGSQDPENEVIQTAIHGTLNVLKGCVRAKSVRRVVYTSSASTLGKSVNTVDESCWTDVDFIRDNKTPGWFYAVSKTLAEKTALKFGEENHINVVSIIPPVVAGPSVTSTVPSSIQVTLSLITGNPQCYGLFKSIHSLSNSVTLIHIQDICNAHIFLMEQPAVEGRYICSGHRTTISELADFISKRYPQYSIIKESDEVPSANNALSSKRLLDLGFSCSYGLNDIIDHSIQYLQKSQTLGAGLVDLLEF